MNNTYYQAADLRDEDRLFIDGVHMVESAILAYEPVSFFDEYMTEAFGKKNASARKPAANPMATGNPNVEKSQMQKNQEAESKGRSGIMKIIDAVLKMARKIREAVTEFMQKRKMDAAERKAYEQFRAMIKADPSLANKKLRVRDFQEMQKRYQGFMKECEDAYRKVQEDANHPIQDLLDKGKNFVKNNLSGVFQSVNAVGLMNMAARNKESARFVLSVVKSDEAMIESMRKEMGDKQFKKWEKDMKKLTKLLSLKRIRMHATNQYFDDYVSAYVGAYQSVFDLAKGLNVKDGSQMEFLNQLMQNQYTGKTIRTVGKAAAGAGIEIGKASAKGAADKAIDLTRRTVNSALGRNDKAPSARAQRRAERKAAKNNPLKSNPILSGFRKPTFGPHGDSDRSFAKKKEK